jgi:excisionase family DNA binding protein
MAETLTVDEAAALCGVTRQTISRRIDRGTLQAVRRDGRRYIPRAELVRVGLLRPEGSEEVEDLRRRLAQAEDELRELRALPAQLQAERDVAAALEAAIHEGRAVLEAERRAREEAERQAREALARASAPIVELILSRLRGRFGRSAPAPAKS